METQELLQAAAVIASGMVGAAYNKQQFDADAMQQIARLAVDIARRIEAAAREAVD